MPITNSPLTGVTLTATSGTSPAVIGTQEIPLQALSLGANSVQITPGSSIYNALQSGATVTPSLQLEYSGLSVVSTAGTPYVPPTPPPPPPVMLDTNGVTLKYTLSSIPSGQSNPYIIQVPEGSGTYYAVMSSNNADSISKIQGYVNYVNSNPTGTTPPNFTAPNQTAIPFNRIVTTLMTNMSEMFMFLNFNQPINSWDTSNVTNMSAMFRSDTIFNQDISSWDTSKVTSMFSMFNGAIIFNQNINYNSSVSTTAWNTSTVTNMDYMFVNDTSFNKDISGWIVTLVQPKPPFNFKTNSGITNAQLPLAFREKK